MFQRKPVKLAPVEPAVASWKSAFEKDPFDVPLDDKIQFLLKLNDTAIKTKGVSFVNSSMRLVNEQQFLATSDGSRIEQYLIRGEPQLTVTAVNRETTTSRRDARCAARRGAATSTSRNIPGRPRRHRRPRKRSRSSRRNPSNRAGMIW